MYQLYQVFDGTLFEFSNKFYKTIAILVFIYTLMITAIGFIYKFHKLNHASFTALFGFGLLYHICFSMFLIFCFINKLFQVVKCNYLMLWRDKTNHSREMKAEGMQSPNILQNKAIAMEKKSPSDAPLSQGSSDIVLKTPRFSKQITVPLPTEDWALIEVMTKYVILHGTCILITGVAGVILLLKQWLELKTAIFDLCGGVWMCVIEIWCVCLFAPWFRKMYTHVCHFCHSCCKHCVHDVAKARLRKIRQNEDIALVIMQGQDNQI
ncbi:hypothetical protein RFI_17758 [Reticulomyxa filosa]|uniref:Uncharacterized protein n=1 Tax=Reticulomyxa filosa TaxID=46433 RepID=X6N097_RETFI|nr:hypothetical protein RFI_17758 [Reticulomyxa filosa]|eukprot:ETO19471.1 hypothetical protein RFI_17758 [Reticulomyxa filosa]